MGYEEHCVGWRVHNLKGKYSFSNDIIFNENLSARLGVPHSLSPSDSNHTLSDMSLSPPHVHD